MRKTIVSCIAILSLATLTACTPKDPLPTDVQNVGVDLPIMSAEVLPSANVIPSGEVVGPVSSETDAPVPSNAVLVTADDVKTWLADIVTGEYTSTTDSMLTKETAQTHDGGTVIIMTLGDTYRGTEFRYLVEEGEPLAEASPEAPARPTGAHNTEERPYTVQGLIACLSAYIGRDMTSVETDELQTGISNALLGTDIYYMESIQDSAEVYIFQDDGYIVVQCR